MNRGIPVSAALTLALAVAACAAPQPRPELPVPVQPSTPVAQAMLPQTTVSGVLLHHPRPGLYTSAQPGAGDWMRLPALGIDTVINLRPQAEMQGRDEAVEVRDAGLAYVNISIAGADEVTPENARALQQAIDAASGNVLVHCASGNRAGALLALAAHANGMAPADALAFGKASGLTGLEPVVRGRLDLPAAACTAQDGRC